MKFYGQITALLFILLTQQLFPQGAFNKKVATVGSKEISSEEFLQRYEFTPFTGKHNRQTLEQNKLNFLYTLVSERLWALEAENRGLDTTEVIRFSLEQFRKMFARDALFAREIKSRITVSNEELAEGLLRQNTKLNVRFLFSENEEEIKNLHKLLEKEVDFDSLLSERLEYEEQVQPVEVVFGQMEFSVEDSLYSLQPGEYTQPVLSPDGWYIFKLVNRAQNLMRDANPDDEVKTVNKIITARKLNEQYRAYFIDFFKDKKVDVNARLSKLLSEKLISVLEEKYNKRGVKDDNLISLTAPEVLQLEEAVGSEYLPETYMEIEGNPYSLKYFIRLLAFDGFSVKPAELKFIPSIIFQRNRTVIERELLAIDAVNKKYHLLPEVLNDIEMWKNNYLFQIMHNQFADSVQVSETEAREYYEQRYKEAVHPPLVNIIEVFNDSADVMEMVVNEIQKGTDIRKLALLYSKREITKKENGESGLVSIYQLGEIGQTAYNMEPGEIYGPVLINNGFSIFKLLEKKTEYKEQSRSFESLRDEITQKLTSKKLKGKLHRYTTFLASKYGFEVDEQVLSEIQVTNINSIAFRNMGFGGKITAVPLIAPDFNWVHDFYEKIYLP